MKHANGYSAYAKEHSEFSHKPSLYPIEWQHGRPICGLCSYPLVGVTETEEDTKKQVQEWEDEGRRSLEAEGIANKRNNPLTR